MPCSTNASYSSSRSGRMTAAESGTRTHRSSLDELCEPRHRLGVRFGQHAVTEVEDVARPARGAREHVERRRLRALPRTEQHCRIEVALHTAVVADSRPAV